MAVTLVLVRMAMVVLTMMICLTLRLVLLLAVMTIEMGRVTWIRRDTAPTASALLMLLPAATLWLVMVNGMLRWVHGVVHVIVVVAMMVLGGVVMKGRKLGMTAVGRTAVALRREAQATRGAVVEVLVRCCCGAVAPTAILFPCRHRLPQEKKKKREAKERPRGEVVQENETASDGETDGARKLP